MSNLLPNLSGVEFDGLGEYNGVVEYALSVALIPPYFDPQRDIVQRQVDGAELALSGYLSTPEATAVERAAETLMAEAIVRVRYVDQNKFRPTSEYSADFGRAALSLLHLYRKPYFGFGTTQTRSVTASRLLEHTDETVQKAMRIQTARIVVESLKFDTSSTGVEEKLQSRISQLSQADPDEFRATAFKAGF